MKNLPKLTAIVTFVMIGTSAFAFGGDTGATGTDKCGGTGENPSHGGTGSSKDGAAGSGFNDHGLEVGG